MGRLVTIETLPHFQCVLTFQSASQGNVNMILNAEDLDSFTDKLNKARAAMGTVDAEHVEEEETAV